MRCLILDDEAPARRELTRLLAAHPDVEVAGAAADVEAALALTARLRPDAVFLDIRLRGETGFDYAGRLPADVPAPRIVFITAWDRHAVRAFECNALDYLLKPVHPARLAAALDRIRRHITPLPAADLRPDDRTLLRIGSTARLVAWRDIIRVISEGNYSRVFTKTAPPALVLRTLKEWTALAPPGFFLQAHRTTLVQRDCVREVRPAAVPNRHELELIDGSVVSISRPQWPAIRDALDGT